jgi:hypothetical protein
MANAVSASRQGGDRGGIKDSASGSSWDALAGELAHPHIVTAQDAVSEGAHAARNYHALCSMGGAPPRFRILKIAPGRALAFRLSRYRTLEWRELCECAGLCLWRQPHSCCTGDINPLKSS